MKRALILSSIAALVLTAGGCAGRVDRTMQGVSGIDSGYVRARSLAAEGRHDEALDMLRCLTAQGSGFEIAAHLGGVTAFDAADAASDPAAAAAYREEGFALLETASRAGWPAAQAELATRKYALGDTESLREAAFWAAVYRMNPREAALGVNRIEPAVLRGIEQDAGQQLIVAATEAAMQFAPRPMRSTPAEMHCATLLRPQREVVRRQFVPSQTSDIGRTGY